MESPCSYHPSDMMAGKTSLLSIPYQNSEPSGSTDTFDLPYLPYNPKSTSHISPFTNEQVTGQFKRFEVPGGDSFIPETIQVREQKSKKGKKYADRIVLLGQNKLHYKVFELLGEEAQKGEDGDIDMSQER